MAKKRSTVRAKPSAVIKRRTVPRRRNPILRPADVRTILFDLAMQPWAHVKMGKKSEPEE